MKNNINLVWFKRDLRLKDHLPLKTAIEDNLPILMIYIFEPSLISAPYSDERHWRFVFESITDLNESLKKYNQKIYMLLGEVISVFDKIIENYQVNRVYSYQETGTWLTYQRDIQVKNF